MDAACFIPQVPQCGRLRGPGGVSLNHVNRERRRLLPEVFDGGSDLAIEGTCARGLPDQIPLNARLQRRSRQIARAHHHDPAGSIGDPPRLRMKRGGRAAQVFQFCKPGLERLASDISPAEQPPQGRWGRDAEIIPHDQAHAGTSSDGGKDRLLHNVETGGLHERHQQVYLACTGEPADEIFPQRRVGMTGRQ